MPAEPWLKVPDGAELLGVVPYGDVIALMRAASIVVVPSKSLDPCPTVVLEAMASGRPVVAAASGGIVDLVDDGVTGVLVPPGDTERLAAALSAMIADPKGAAAMGRAGLDRVRMFTASTVVGAHRRSLPAGAGPSWRAAEAVVGDAASLRWLPS